MKKLFTIDDFTIKEVYPMNAQNAPKHVGLLIALDGLLSLAVLAVAGYYIKYFYAAIEAGNASGQWGLVALMEHS